ncbi:MAG: hypothetical protein JRF64_11155 [Deltaproteobacteria bacterium]|nr:hypothetical protein [Deltaproteobacteria bacterium]
MEIPHKKEIERIIGQMQCSKDFECYESGFETLCKAKDVGMESYLSCLEEHPFECKFLVGFFGDRYYCECPLRIYIAKKLGK